MKTIVSLILNFNLYLVLYSIEFLNLNFCIISYEILKVTLSEIKTLTVI